MLNIVDADYALALSLQNELNKEPWNDTTVVSASSASSSSSSSQNSKKCLVDPSWELIDPNPDIFTLFKQFNETFFWNKLTSVEVRWSPRMTLCAGLCCYEGHGGLCSVRLSQPLLKLRPRKDLVETLLHEMIHAYLFVTANNRDRDGHGPEFCKHMRRINTSAGTNITIYHDFVDEVAEMRKHWWRCSGRCRSKPPYFGYVKRAMNRAPSKNDFWWEEHQRACGGTYEKIKEPDDYGKKKGKTKPAQQKQKSSGESGRPLNQSRIDFPTKSKQPEQGHVLGGSIPGERPARGIPSTSRLLAMFSQGKDVEDCKAFNSCSPLKRKLNSLKSDPSKSLHKVRNHGVHRQNNKGSNLASVCQQIRRTGTTSVNENAAAFQRFKVVTKFLTAKERKERVNFSSDDEFDDIVVNKAVSSCFSQKELNRKKTSEQNPNNLLLSDITNTDESCSTDHSIKRNSAQRSEFLLKDDDSISEGFGKRKQQKPHHHLSPTFRSPVKKKPYLQLTSNSSGSPKTKVSAEKAQGNNDISTTIGRNKISTHVDNENSKTPLKLSSFCEPVGYEASDSSSDEDDDVLLSSVLSSQHKPVSQAGAYSPRSKNLLKSLNVDASSIGASSSVPRDNLASAVSEGEAFRLPSRVSCPICDELVSSEDINSHVDICLSLKAIRESNF